MSKAEESKQEVENDWGQRAFKTFAEELASLERTSKGFKKLYARNIITVDTKQCSKPSGSKSELLLMQFNVLADGLSGLYEPETAGKVFVAVPKECLFWDYRGIRIIEEIKRFDPDVVTIQELDQLEFLRRNLKGYKVEYLKNKKSACLMVGEKYNHKLLPDGVAVFYREKFHLLGVLKFEGDKPIEISALVVHLQLKSSKKEVLVATIHLKSAKDIEGEKIRLKQLARFLPELKKYQESKERPNFEVPIFIGCDLNGPPIKSKDFDPFAYTSIALPDKFNELLTAHNKSSEKAAQINDKELGYTKGWGVNLSSAYRDVLGAEPNYTTWKKRGDGIDQHTIDYIFYQKDKHVRVSKLLSIPTEKEVNQSTFLPGWEYPSDHFSIMAGFEF